MIAFQNSFRDAKLFYQGIFTYMSTYWQNTAQESELVYGLSQHLRGKQTKIHYTYKIIIEIDD